MDPERVEGLRKALEFRREADYYLRLGDSVRSHGLDSMPYIRAAGRFMDWAELLEEQYA